MFGSRQLGGMMFMSLTIGLVAGLVLAGFGVWLVSLGAQGTAKVALLGQQLDSTNVGITSIFIGAVTLIFVVRRTLKSIDLLATHQPMPVEAEIATTPLSEEKRAERALTLDQLSDKVRYLSSEQRELLAMIYRAPRGAMVVDVQDALDITRSEAVYRARDLASAGLIEIVTQTDQCFMLRRQVRELNKADPESVERIVMSDL
jgi:hypothetical protein